MGRHPFCRITTCCPVMNGVRHPAHGPRWLCGKYSNEHTTEAHLLLTCADSACTGACKFPFCRMASDNPLKTTPVHLHATTRDTVPTGVCECTAETAAPNACDVCMWYKTVGYDRNASAARRHQERARMGVDVKHTRRKRTLFPPNVVDCCAYRAHQEARKKKRMV